MDILYEKRMPPGRQVVVYDGRLYYNIMPAYAVPLTSMTCERIHIYRGVYLIRNAGPGTPYLVHNFGQSAYKPIIMDATEPFASLDVLALLVQALL